MQAPAGQFPPQDKLENDGTATPATPVPVGGQFQPEKVVSRPLIAVLPPIATAPRVVRAPSWRTFGMSSLTSMPARRRALIGVELPPARPSETNSSPS